MPEISEDDASLLIELGVLDVNLRVTPEAYVGAIARKPVDEQAKLLGLPVIICPDRGSGSPEQQFAKYFSSRTSMHVDGGQSWSTEGFCIKHLLSTLIPEFDYRVRHHRFSRKEIDRQVERLDRITQMDVVKAAEPFMDPNEIEFVFKDPGVVPDVMDEKFFRKRFRDSKCRIISCRIADELDEERIAEVRTPRKEKNYAAYMARTLALWNSLERSEWKELARVVLTDWSKLYAGWPDLTFFSPDLGLALVEIKGKDRIHASQVYTLLTLKSVLGAHRLAIGWINSGRINFSGHIYKAHMSEAVAWFNTPSLERRPLKEPIFKL